MKMDKEEAIATKQNKEKLEQLNNEQKVRISFCYLLHSLHVHTHIHTHTVSVNQASFRGAGWSNSCHRQTCGETGQCCPIQGRRQQRGRQ